MFTLWQQLVLLSMGTCSPVHRRAQVDLVCTYFKSVFALQQQRDKVHKWHGISIRVFCSMTDGDLKSSVGSGSDDFDILDLDPAGRVFVDVLHTCSHTHTSIKSFSYKLLSSNTHVLDRAVMCFYPCRTPPGPPRWRWRISYRFCQKRLSVW